MRLRKLALFLITFAGVGLRRGDRPVAAGRPTRPMVCWGTNESEGTQVLKRAFIWVACTLFATSASAHPGHGVPDSGFSLTHHLTEPLHVLMIVGTLTVLAALRFRLVRRHRSEARRIR